MVILVIVYINWSLNYSMWVKRILYVFEFLVRINKRVGEKVVIEGS